MRECKKRSVAWLIKTASMLVFVTISSLFFANGPVFAASTLSMSIYPDSVNMDLLPGQFDTLDQTITASTTSVAGYQIIMDTAGPSSSLIERSDHTRTIPTFELPSGSTSIPVESLGEGYGYSLDNGANFFPVLEPSSPSVELFKTTTAGSNEHTLTFGVNAPMDATAGTYDNTFNISIIANIASCPAENICYYGNEDDGTGTMDNQAASSSSEAVLLASNFSRPGYGFAGWNTEIDGTGTNYGPSETITTGDLSLEGLQLFAKWIPSAGSLQSWDGCSNLNSGDITALTDIRDGSTYTVAKYADGQCWMAENLRLDLSNKDLHISSFNTNSPTADFSSYINENHPDSTNDFCATNSRACVDQIMHNTNNTNRNLEASYDANNTSSSWYSYGNYYNWHTITAGNGSYDDSTAGATVSGDICPANWKLPTGYGINGNLAKLDIAMGGSGVNQASGTAEGLAGTLRWRKYPLNFIYSGEQKGPSAANRAISSSYATQNIGSVERTTNLWLKTDGVYMNSNITYKYRGQTARCIFRGNYSVNGNIHYDANGGTGTMTDEININFGTASAASNEFTKQHATFVGWNTQPNGGGIAVAEGGSVADAAESMSLAEGDTLILYAIWKPIYSLIYNGNNSDAGSMSSVDISDLKTGKLSLVASNFSRIGYGFAGWSLDPDAAAKLVNGDSVTMYGPNVTITVDNEFLSHADVNNRINLYAIWIPEDSTYTMQAFGSTECAAMSQGSVLALRDDRDNNVYTIAKLEDNHCWMTENLRLDPSTTTFNASNTNSPTQTFIDNAPYSETSNKLCNTDNSTCVDTIRFNSNNINRNLPASHNSNTIDKSWYSYGVMYNWHTASAGNGSFTMDTGNVAGDICPAGWRLPTGGNNSDFTELNRLANNSSTTSNAGLVKFPDNFIFSGDYNYNAPGGRSTFSRFWSATTDGSIKAYRLGINASTDKAVTPTGSWNKWDAFAVRCIVK